MLPWVRSVGSWRSGTDVLPLEEGIRRAAGRSSQAAERAGTENTQLKKAVADLTLDNMILKEVGPKKLLSPAKRRRAIYWVREQMAVSERRACRVLDQSRSTQRQEVMISEEEERLRERIVDLACAVWSVWLPRMTALLRNEGWRVNHKRVERIWRQEGLKVPQRQPNGDGCG